MAKLTVGQAAEIWKDAKARESKAAADIRRSAPILKAHLAKTGKPFKGITLNRSTRMQLDTDAVRAELGDRIETFQKPVAIESLALI